MQCPRCFQKYYGVGFCPTCQSPLYTEHEVYRMARRDDPQWAKRGTRALDWVLRIVIRLAAIVLLATATLYGMVRLPRMLLQLRREVTALQRHATRAHPAPAGETAPGNTVRQIREKWQSAFTEP